MGVIAMHPEPEGQNGHCGNFDGNPRDDRAIIINTRREGRLLSLADVAAAPNEPAAAEDTSCTADDLENATAVCTALCDGEHGGELAQLFVYGCIYDVCRAGPEIALSDCLTAWQTRTALDPAPFAAAISETATLVGEGCCKPWQTIIGNAPSLTRSECAIQCLSTDNCNAFAISGCDSSSDETCGGRCHLYQMSSQEEATSGACYEQALNGNTFCYSVQ